ncbi:MAG: xanthine dehydrogenase family protein molybdopterin-binding subunit [Gemmatimonadota bacterium]
MSPPKRQGEQVSRRDFLSATVAGGAGLVIAVELSSCAKIENKVAAIADKLEGPLPPSAFVQVAPDGAITIWITKSEIGQGVRTSLAMIVAEELEADWSTVKVRNADYQPRFPDMETGGSSSVSGMWNPLRTAGAQAREMLVLAAARQWGVPATECRPEKGIVHHDKSGRRLSYGDLSVRAATMPVTAAPRLKAASDYRLIGWAIPSLDAPDRVSGKVKYGLDTVVPGMQYAVIARCPVIGGKMKGYDPAAALKVPGVLAVHAVTAGVAVIATSTWNAMQGRKALTCQWDDAAAASLNSAALSKQLRERVEQAGALVQEVGTPRQVIASAAKVITADYEVPFLAHAPMEPANCTASYVDGRCEIWAPTQAAGTAVSTVAARLGIAKSAVTLHVTMIGGGFGRRLLTDEVVEAAEVSRATGTPVKLTWTREDDMRHAWYRPAGVNRLQAALDVSGMPLAWTHRVATPSIDESHNPGSVKNDLDPFATDGAAMQYAIPHLRIEHAMVRNAVPVSWWRSVYASQNVFATECFLDEVAHAAGQDPVAYRRALLARSPRELAVLELVAEKSGWGKPAPGRYQGVALHHFFSDSVVAEVAEVSVDQGVLRVHRVVCAVDCGLVVNPDGVRAQLMGGVLFGLSAALFGAITVEKGAIVQGNFDGYRVLRMSEAPVVEVHIVPSSESPKGVGEPGLPPIAPAVANAIFAATGKRVRRLPIEV